MIKSFCKSLFIIYLGVSVTALMGAILHVAQGLILDNWSGIHPYNRLIFVFVYFLIGVLLVSPLAINLIVIRGKLLTAGSGFTLGLISGGWCFVYLINPFVGYKYSEPASLLVILVLLVLFLRYFVKYQHENGKD